MNQNEMLLLLEVTSHLSQIIFSFIILKILSDIVRTQKTLCSPLKTVSKQTVHPATLEDEAREIRPQKQSKWTDMQRFASAYTRVSWNGKNKKTEEEIHLEVKQICEEYGLPLRVHNNGKAIRVGGFLDIFPKSMRYHYIPANSRFNFIEPSGLIHHYLLYHPEYTIHVNEQ